MLFPTAQLQLEPFFGPAASRTSEAWPGVQDALRMCPTQPVRRRLHGSMLSQLAEAIGILFLPTVGIQEPFFGTPFRLEVS